MAPFYDGKETTMFKKTITYTDYNGDERKEDFFFNLSKAELLEMQLSTNGGLQGFLMKIIETKDMPKLVEMFKEIIMRAYGEKSLDGKHFMKSEEIRRNFECSPAYSELFMELATNSDSAAEFINALLPDDYKASEADMIKMRKEIEG